MTETVSIPEPLAGLEEALKPRGLILEYTHTQTTGYSGGLLHHSQSWWGCLFDPGKKTCVVTANAPSPSELAGKLLGGLR